MNNKMFKIGGQSSSDSGIMSRVKNIMSTIGWKQIGIVILLVVLAVIFYLIYKNYVEPMTNSVYNTNKSSNTNTGKEAEIMLFSTDWCPHCKTAKPEWEQVKAEYDGKQINGYKIIFTDVNCTNESPEVEKMMNTYKIEGFPTIKLVKDNQIIDYDAKPTKDTLTQFLNTVI